ncbi:hypothetical protein TCAL_03529 [Tigriopus californicus]|uniref:RING-type domain-containing protein n=1 Tax=Tigriopus californicus TaxID=6832 RepID=A0A553PGQ9_TIGCA|nr:hypothetical protein TCAL_03529 [Tigriopus californicus]
MDPLKGRHEDETVHNGIELFGPDLAGGSMQRRRKGAKLYVSAGMPFFIGCSLMCLFIYVVMIKQIGLVNIVNQVGMQVGLQPLIGPNSRRPGRLRMQATPLPCYLQLKECAPSEISLKHVPVSLSSKSGAQLQMRVFYGVDIALCHHVMAGPWPWLKDAFLNGRPFGQDGCLDVSEHLSVSLSEGETRELILPRPSSGHWMDLGRSSPRNKYPIVLVSLTGLDGAKAVVATFHVIHIQDEVCTLPTQILASYVKRGAGPLVHLDRIFYSDSFQDERNYNLCVVCQDFPISRVNLPCKHACVCQRCFGMIRNLCPMCRSPIQHYFLIKGENHKATWVLPHPTQ